MGEGDGAVEEGRGVRVRVCEGCCECCRCAGVDGKAGRPMD